MFRWRRPAKATQDHGGRVAGFEIDGRILFEVMAWWEHMGAWGTSGHIVEVSATALDADIGQALLVALRASRQATVITDASGPKFLLAKAGVKSAASLQRKSRRVSVGRSPEGLVQLSPTTAEGSGWVGAAPEDSIHLEDPSAEELGAALRLAMSQCRLGEET